MDIAEFIAARLDEDEQGARAAWQCRSHNSDDPRTGSASWQAVGSLLLSEQPSGVYDDVAEVINYGLDDVLVHAARHDPARVLADVAAKRAILTVHCTPAAAPADDWRASDYMREWPRKDSCLGCGRSGPCDDPNVEDINDCPTLRALALAYADHRDYLYEWSVTVVA